MTTRPPSSERPLPAHLMQLCSAVRTACFSFAAGKVQLKPESKAGIQSRGLNFAGKVNRIRSGQARVQLSSVNSFETEEQWAPSVWALQLSGSTIYCQVLTRIVSAFVDVSEGVELGGGLCFRTGTNDTSMSQFFVWSVFGIQFCSVHLQFLLQVESPLLMSWNDSKNSSSVLGESFDLYLSLSFTANSVVLNYAKLCDLL